MRLWLTIALLALLAFIASGKLDSKAPGIRKAGTFEIVPPTPYFHYFPQTTERGRMLVVHGLDSNKEMMNLLCLALADAGFDVYSIDLPGHGDSTAGFNAELARKAVDGVLDILGPHTSVLGHSLGAALLLDLAHDRTFDTMVLASPAPTTVDRIHANRVLVLTADYDIPRIHEFVPRLQDAGAESIEFRTIPWAGHSGYLLEPKPIREIVAWLGGDISGIHTGYRWGMLLLQMCIALLIPAMWLRGKPIAAVKTHISRTVLSYIASGLVALFMSGFVVVLNGLRLFSTGYLISFVFLVGVTQLPSCYRQFSIRFSKIPVILFASAYVITIAAVVGSELVHLTLGGLTGGRWWRFIAIAVAVLPLCFADEILLRPIRPWWKAAGVAALTRILIAALAVTGVLTMNRGDAFLVLILHFVVVLWIGLWLAGEVIRRHTQDPLATALFTALVQAWVFAAIFVLV